MKKNPPRTAVVKLKLTECEHHGAHITDAELLTDSATVYEAPDANATIGASVGWSRTYATNWDRMFGAKREIN